MESLSGSMVAIVTPMHKDGSIDFSAFLALLEWHLAEGTQGIVIGGTTGESALLDEAELAELVDAACEAINQRMRIVVGTGGISTEAVARRSKLMSGKPIDACMVVTPYYLRPSQSGLIAHFTDVAEASERPVILYNVPSRTGCDLLPETVAVLARHENIIAIKEAGAKERISEHVNLSGQHIEVLTGEDGQLLDALRRGAVGIVSVAANAIPGKIQAICSAALEHDWQSAEEIVKQVASLNELLFVEPNPIPVKWLLAELGKIGPYMRRPLTPLTDRYQLLLWDAYQQVVSKHDLKETV